MKKLILRGVLFLFVSTILYVGIFSALYFITNNKTPLVFRLSESISPKGGNALARFAEYDPAIKHDIVVLGSSHAYRGYDPRIFAQHGYSMFNMGSSSETVVNTYYIAKNYINRNNCSVVLLDVFEYTLESDGIESLANLTANASKDAAVLEMAVGMKDLRAINMFTYRKLNMNKKRTHSDKTYVEKGYCSRTDSVSERIEYTRHEEFKPNPLQVGHLNKLLSYLKDEGIKVVLVTHPSPRRNDLGKHLAFKKLIDKIAAEYEVTYLDHAFSHRLHERHHFYNVDHLNQSGVTIYNESLIPDLKELGL